MLHGCHCNGSSRGQFFIDNGSAVKVNDDGSETATAVVPASAPAGPKPSEGLKVDELKAALEAKGISIPDGAKKQELADLLDGAQ
ncbi:hypothetical protein EJO66_31130 [Variovorax beijingensis]|uniref:HeH/LEM domain-containing protein n=1 Tax=Variovorax beijingensis TaxID=2496117 RepID=A0ABX9ZXZ9_9BURK|nr:hypothetical protein EJO66_31130 [Variovorax beijingensis]